MCLPVGHEQELCKHGWTDRDAVCGVKCGLVGPRNHVLGGGPESPAEMGSFEGTAILERSRFSALQRPLLLGAVHNNYLTFLHACLPTYMKLSRGSHKFEIRPSLQQHSNNWRPSRHADSFHGNTATLTYVCPTPAAEAQRHAFKRKRSFEQFVPQIFRIVINVKREKTKTNGGWCLCWNFCDSLLEIRIYGPTVGLPPIGPKTA